MVHICIHPLKFNPFKIIISKILDIVYSKINHEKENLNHEKIDKQ